MAAITKNVFSNQVSNFKNLILSLVDANIPKMKVSGTKKLKPVWLTNN